MADVRQQLEAYKAAAKSYQLQIHNAKTKDEALDFAIGVAENLMKALKLSKDPEEKRALKSQCDTVLDVAARIKRAEQWTPPKRSKSDEINKWASDVAFSSVESNLPLLDLSHDTNPGMSATTTRVTSSMSSITAVETRETVGSARDKSKSSSTPVEGLNLPFTNMFQGVTPSNNTLLPTTKIQSDAFSAITGAPSKLGSQDAKTRPGINSTKAPSIAPPVRKLNEPVSTRKRTNKEEILLLKSSRVNGYVCPPWKFNPSSSDFTDGSTLFKDIRDLSLSSYQHQFFAGWVRASEAIPPPSMFPDNRTGLGPMMVSSRSIDLVQDAATDCSVVASLCAGIARGERGHHQMLASSIWPFDEMRGKPVISPNGKYIVRLNFNGCWRKVEIDDRLPLSSGHRLLHVFDRRNPCLLWPILLEKAYLKVRGGYDFPGSNSCSDLWIMTGWIPEQVYLQEVDTVPEKLWSRIYKAFLYGDVLITVGTGKMERRQEREIGLEGQHSYVVLDVRETDHEKLMLVKNPWAEGKGWRGPRPATAPLPAQDSSSRSSDMAINTDGLYRNSIPIKDQPHPTTFWISFDQVVQNFESLYLNWNPGLFRHRQDIHFEWLVDDLPGAGYCIVKHPQFALTTKKSETVWVLLSRHFRDSCDDTKMGDSDTFNNGSIREDAHIPSSGEILKGFMSIYICDGNGQRIYVKESYLESTPYVNTPQCLLRLDSDAGAPYTVVIDQEELPPSNYTFSLSAFSNSTISLEPVTERYPIQKTQEGEWTKQTAGGNASLPRYYENPQYTLQVKQKCSLAILLSSAELSNPLHVKLAIGHGKRIYQLHTRDVVTDSGDHRGGCVFAEAKDLQAGQYTIVCSLFEAGLTGDYTLRIDSTHEVGLKQIPRDGAGLILMRLAPAVFAPTINKIAAPLSMYRQASITVVARFSKTTSPRSSEVGRIARSPLRLSVEFGRGPERKILIASEHGEYTDRPIVRTESLSLEPVISRGPEGLWLVLDRLSGPGGPIEEWYEVEVFIDMPNACQIGVWREWSD
ncbi:cysteine proteinase [Amniculicola lignicola CBS 123094]|uniref:Cysteine proteinase n=1 Tax=Amniculicola lignicola CBS 123094 TaxID=1392246 RepID=A0A6A5WH30_9PLEO|nr:cysteine proteinase [Amniculicola lignicola CBS 123094]